MKNIIALVVLFTTSFSSLHAEECLPPSPPQTAPVAGAQAGFNILPIGIAVVALGTAAVILVATRSRG